MTSHWNISFCLIHLRVPGTYSTQQSMCSFDPSGTEHASAISEWWEGQGQPLTLPFLSTLFRLS